MIQRPGGEEGAGAAGKMSRPSSSILFEQGSRGVEGRRRGSPPLFDKRNHLPYHTCRTPGMLSKNAVEELSMPTVPVMAELTVENLIDAVSQLTPRELSEFTLRFDELRLARMASVNEQAAQIAEAYRLPSEDRLRVLELLMKNREEGLTEQEEAELDAYMHEMDRRLDQVASELFALAQRRKRLGDELTQS